mmetsp:Transcript_17508/g.26580  ORF Transcript_17508/g.26580 Transcript_17508/m.26580 type:complete len:86 (+) Transcript_17508:782-1039(+)
MPLVAFVTKSIKMAIHCESYPAVGMNSMSNAWINGPIPLRTKPNKNQLVHSAMHLYFANDKIDFGNYFQFFHLNCSLLGSNSHEA